MTYIAGTSANPCQKFHAATLASNATPSYTANMTTETFLTVLFIGHTALALAVLLATRAQPAEPTDR